MPVQTPPRAVRRSDPRLPRAERRTAARRPGGLEGTCRPLLAPHAETWPGTVLNLSAEGVGLLLRRRFEPGVLLAVEIAAGREGRSLLARVVHARPAGGGWLVGCRFLSPLDDDELRVILP